MPVDFGVCVFGGAGASSPLSLLTATSAEPSPPHTSPLLFGPPLLCGASCFPHPKPPSPAELPLHHPLPVFSGARQQWGNTLGGVPAFRGSPLQVSPLRESSLWGSSLWGSSLWGSSLWGSSLWGSLLQVSHP